MTVPTNCDFAGAWLPQALGPGDRADVTIEIRVPEQPGRLASKVDLVRDGSIGSSGAGRRRR
jgi:hypothetical protein